MEFVIFERPNSCLRDGSDEDTFAEQRGVKEASIVDHSSCGGGDDLHRTGRNYDACVERRTAGFRCCPRATSHWVIGSSSGTGFRGVYIQATLFVANDGGGESGASSIHHRWCSQVFGGYLAARLAGRGGGGGCKRL